MTTRAEEPQVRRVLVDLCDLCLSGVGGECHVPGCALWLSAGPDIGPIRAEIVPDVEGDVIERTQNELRHRIEDLGLVQEIEGEDGGEIYDSPRVYEEAAEILTRSLAEEGLLAYSKAEVPEECEHHSWAGLMSLLDEHWPEDIFPTPSLTEVQQDRRDPGPTIVSLIRYLDAVTQLENLRRRRRLGSRRHLSLGAESINPLAEVGVFERDGKCKACNRDRVRRQRARRAAFDG